MSCANVSVAIAVAGGLAMLLAASGTPLNVHDQIQAVRSQLSGGSTKAAALTPILPMATAVLPPPADVVSLAWSNGIPVKT